MNAWIRRHPALCIAGCSLLFFTVCSVVPDWTAWIPQDNGGFSPESYATFWKAARWAVPVVERHGFGRLFDPPYWDQCFKLAVILGVGCCIGFILVVQAWRAPGPIPKPPVNLPTDPTPQVG